MSGGRELFSGKNCSTCRKKGILSFQSLRHISESKSFHIGKETYFFLLDIHDSSVQDSSAQLCVTWTSSLKFTLLLISQSKGGRLTWRKHQFVKWYICEGQNTVYGQGTMAKGKVIRKWSSILQNNKVLSDKSHGNGLGRQVTHQKPMQHPQEPVNAANSLYNF